MGVGKAGDGKELSESAMGETVLVSQSVLGRLHLALQSGRPSVSGNPKVLLVSSQCGMRTRVQLDYACTRMAGMVVVHSLAVDGPKKAEAALVCTNRRP